MNAHQFVEDAPLVGVRRSASGYLMAEVRAARTGVQDYLGHELGHPERERIRVYRPPEAVFSKASMATYAGKPLTSDHPAEPVTAENWRKYAIGQIQNDDIARDGESVRVPVMLMDAAAIQAVESGKRQVSAGYTMSLTLLDSPAVTDSGETYDAIAGDIKINHLAVVQAGRAGPEHRIGDAVPNQSLGARPITTADGYVSPVPSDGFLPSTTPTRETSMTLKTITVDGYSVETTDQAEKAINKLQGAIQTANDALSAAQATHDAAISEAKAKAVSDAEAAKVAHDAAMDGLKATHDAAIAEKDGELATKDAEITELKSKVLDEAAIDARVEAKAALVSKASAIAKDADFKGKSEAEIKAFAVDAVHGAGFSADKTPAYIDVAFDLLKIPTGTGDSVRDALINRAPVSDAASDDHGYEAMVNRIKNAHKPKEAV